MIALSCMTGRQRREVRGHFKPAAKRICANYFGQNEFSP
jgi:hypothetical protein